MFDGSSFPLSLDETIFDAWLEKGRISKMSFNFLLIIWDECNEAYHPVYAEERHSISEYQPYGSSTTRESLVAVYDLYSESRISLESELK